MNLDAWTMTDEELTALHEAGHAVAHHAAGWPCLSATIIPTKEYSGRVSHDPAVRCPDGELEALVFVAGPMAVDLLISGHWVWRGSEYPDYAAARLALWCKYFPSPQLTAERDAAISAQLDALAASIGAARLGSLWARLNADARPDQVSLIERGLAAACCAAEKLLRRLWPSVIAVAGALLERKTLSGEEVAAIAESRQLTTDN
jgi:hypothetical protein